MPVVGAALFRPLRCLLALLLAVMVRLLRASWRVRHLGDPPAGPALFAFWHGDQLALTGATALVRPRVLVSRSADGELAARVARAVGLSTIRGSSSRGAVFAGVALVRCLRRGISVAVAADGPRGPHHRGGGALGRLARCGCARLVPVAAAASRGWRLRSWDRLLIPAPFATVYVVWGERLASEIDAEAALQRVGARALGLARGSGAGG